MPVLGQLEDKETGEILLEEEFESYNDAYWALMEMDTSTFLAKIEVANTDYH